MTDCAEEHEPCLHSISYRAEAMCFCCPEKISLSNWLRAKKPNFFVPRAVIRARPKYDSVLRRTSLIARGRHSRKSPVVRSSACLAAAICAVGQRTLIARTGEATKGAAVHDCFSKVPRFSEWQS